MKYLSVVFFGLTLTPAIGVAGVDKIYEPYVHQSEIEVEARGVHQFDDDNEHKLKLGIGYGVTSTWFLEGYAIVEKESDESTKLADVELESKFQLTEQGRYLVDLGLLVELEKSLDHDKWELKAGPLLQKQFGRWSATANLFLEKQFGNARSSSEVEVLGAARLKYRLSPTLEPAIEYYADEDAHSIGPVLSGNQHWGKTPIKWEVGVLGGLNHNSPDISLRWLLEFEFY